MNTLLIEPLKYYDDAARRHNDSVTARFEELVNQSGIDVEQNRQTVKKYQDKLAEINVVSSRLMKFTALLWGIILSCFFILIGAFALISNFSDNTAAIVITLIIAVVLVAVLIIIAIKKIRPKIKDAQQIKAALVNTAEEKKIRSKRS